VVTAHALAFGSLLLVGGRIGDLFGRKWTFIGVPHGYFRPSAPRAAFSHSASAGSTSPAHAQ
jgi:hypothetical protein